jgi:hypothetical protein
MDDPWLRIEIADLYAATRWRPDRCATRTGFFAGCGPNDGLQEEASSACLAQPQSS